MPRYSDWEIIPIQLSRIACKAEPSGMKLPIWVSWSCTPSRW